MRTPFHSSDSLKAVVTIHITSLKNKKDLTTACEMYINVLYDFNFHGSMHHVSILVNKNDLDTINT